MIEKVNFLQKMTISTWCSVSLHPSNFFEWYLSEINIVYCKKRCLFYGCRDITLESLVMMSFYIKNGMSFSDYYEINNEKRLFFRSWIFPHFILSNVNNRNWKLCMQNKMFEHVFIKKYKINFIGMKIHLELKLSIKIIQSKNKYTVFRRYISAIGWVT